jgi:hypothetical protein
MSIIDLQQKLNKSHQGGPTFHDSIIPCGSLTCRAVGHAMTIFNRQKTRTIQIADAGEAVKSSDSAKNGIYSIYFS